jgi:hypothetical protein
LKIYFFRFSLEPTDEVQGHMLLGLLYRFHQSSSLKCFVELVKTTKYFPAEVGTDFSGTAGYFTRAFEVKFEGFFLC